MQLYGARRRHRALAAHRATAPSGAALGRSRSGVTLLAAPLLTVLQSPLLSHPSEGRQLVSAGLIIDAAPADVKLELGRQLEACPLDIFGGRIVAGLLRALDSALADAASSAPSSERSSAVVVIVRLLGLCRDANVRSGILPPDAFYSPWLLLAVRDWSWLLLGCVAAPWLLLAAPGLLLAAPGLPMAARRPRMAALACP